MNLPDRRRTLLIALVTWLVLGVIVCALKRVEFLSGISIGVFGGALNFIWLSFSVKSGKKIQTGKPSSAAHLTLQFFARYILLALVLLLLIHYGVTHLIGFLIGLSGFYLILFLQQIFLKRKTDGNSQ